MKHEHTADEFNRATGKTTNDVKMIVSDGEDLLKAAANASSESLAAARANFSEQIMSAKAKFADASQPMIEKTKQANEYVHDSPWAAISAAAAIGMLIGFLAAKR